MALDVILFYRFLIAAISILAFLLYTKESLKISSKECLFFVLLGCFYALASEFLFIGYDYLSAAIASTILFTYPVIVALILAVVFKEKITKSVGISLFITLCGVITLSVNETSLNINFGGLFVCMLSALLYAVYIVLVNKFPSKASGVKVTFYSLLFSSIFYLIKSVIGGKSLALPDTEILLDITLFSLLTTTLSVITLVYAIKYIGSTPTSILGALEPVVAVFISIAMFYEKLTFTLVTGVVLILAGVTINLISEGMKSAKAKKIKNANTN